MPIDKAKCMFSDYQINVLDANPQKQNTDHQRQAQRLDRCTQSSHAEHIVLGRHGCEDLLLVSCQRTPSDFRAALVEACGFYACKTGYWPTFFSSKCEIRDIAVHGFARPDCLEFAKHRQMLLLNWKNVGNYDGMTKVAKSDTKPKQWRAPAAKESTPQSPVVAQVA